MLIYHLTAAFLAHLAVCALAFPAPPEKRLQKLESEPPTKKARPKRSGSSRSLSQPGDSLDGSTGRSSGRNGDKGGSGPLPFIKQNGRQTRTPMIPPLFPVDAVKGGFLPYLMHSDSSSSGLRTSEPGTSGPGASGPRSSSRHNSNTPQRSHCSTTSPGSKPADSNTNQGFLFRSKSIPTKLGPGSTPRGRYLSVSSDALHSSLRRRIAQPRSRSLPLRESPTSRSRGPAPTSRHDDRLLQTPVFSTAVRSASTSRYNREGTRHRRNGQPNLSLPRIGSQESIVGS